MTADEYIFGLIDSFPCLRIKLRDYKWPKGQDGRPEFDADRLHAMIGPWSHGERLCALFVLNVWNPGYASHNRWTFDVFEFVGMADSGNRNAMLAWLSKPHWP